jgi:hypothetical protein
MAMVVAGLAVVAEEEEEEEEEDGRGRVDRKDLSDLR